MRRTIDALADQKWAHYGLQPSRRQECCQEFKTDAEKRSVCYHKATVTPADALAQRRGGSDDVASAIYDWTK